MSYLKQTLAYLFRYGKGRRFGTIFLLSLIPAAPFSYFYPFSDYTSFLFGLKTASYPNFSALWLSAFNHDKYSLIALAVTFVLLILVTAYVTTLVTRSIRVGEFGLTKIIYSVNENFFPALATTFFCMVSAFIAHNLFVLLTFLFLQIQARILGVILATIFFIGICIITVYVWSSLTLWLPTMSFSGQYVIKAFGTSFYKSRSYQRRFFVPGLVMLALTFVLSLLAFFAGKLRYIEWIINLINYALILTYLYTFTAIAYCDTEAVTREDMARRYFGR